MNKMNQLIGLLSASVATVLLSSCASVCTSIPDNSNESKEIGQGWFFDDADITSVKPTKLDNGYTQATGTIHNLTSDKQLVQYRIVWFNEDDSPIDDNMPWTPVQLYPNLSKTVTSVAPNKTTKKFIVQACMLEPTNNLVGVYRD